MKGRTRLTTPPGEEPASELSGDATSELYSHGFERPTEPDIPGRHRTKLIAVAVVIVLAALGYVGFVLATEGQFQDPALSELLPGNEDTATPDPTTEQPTTGPTGSASPGQG